MCVLGLNDVIYIAPAFTPSDYDGKYSRMCTGNEFDDFKTFFEHFQGFTFLD